MYYVKCPECGEVIEVSELSSEETCLKCYKRYKVTAQNCLKAPNYDLFYCISIGVLVLGMFVSSEAFSPNADIYDYIKIMSFMLLSIGIGGATGWVRRRIESRLCSERCAVGKNKKKR